MEQIEINTPILKQNQQKIQDELRGLHKLVSSNFESVEDLDKRLSDRFDWLV